MMVKRFCDRCGKHMEMNDNDLINQKYHIVSIHRSAIDICEECQEQLRAWFEERNSFPKGETIESTLTEIRNGVKFLVDLQIDEQTERLKRACSISGVSYK